MFVPLGSFCGGIARRGSGSEHLDYSVPGVVQHLAQWHPITPLCSAVYSCPGVFGTVEMWPSHAGIWRVECKVGEHQQAGMSALFLVYDLSE